MIIREIVERIEELKWQIESCDNLIRLYGDKKKEFNKLLALYLELEIPEIELKQTK